MSRFPRMDPQAMRDRTMQFGLDVIDLVDSLPNRRSAWKIGDQLVRAATSVGANYRAATRGRSKAEFVAKLGIVEEEADETMYWLEVIKRKRMAPETVVDPLLREANELLSIVVASIRTSRRSADFRKSPRSNGRTQSAIQNPKSSVSDSIRNPQSAIRNQE